MVWNTYLESGPLGCKLLVMKHGLQNLLVTPGDQAHGTQNFKNCDLCTNVFRGQTLSNDVDTVWMSKHMSSTLLEKNKEKTHSVNACMYKSRNTITWELIETTISRLLFNKKNSNITAEK